MEDVYERALAIWLGRKQGLDPDKIENARFEAEDGYEYSEYTYESARAKIEFRYDGSYRAQYIDYANPVELVREVSDIIAELRKGVPA